MNKKLIILFSLLSIFLFFGFAYDANAATYYWVGGTTNSNTSNTANWNTVAGACADSGNVTAPIAGDTVNFVSNCLNNATVDSALSVTNFNMVLGYTGIVTNNSTITATTVTVNNGTLNITAGSTMSDTNGIISDVVDSNATVTVSGVGASWTNSTSLVVGGFGIGNLNILNNGAVSVSPGAGSCVGCAGQITIGNGATGDGTITISGSGSSLTNSNARFTVGSTSGAIGRLIIQNGGSASTGFMYGAYNVGTTAEITIDGTGSTWTSDVGSVAGLGFIGRAGTASLTISNGGVVSSVASPWQVGGIAGGNGTIDISGAGSSLTMTIGTLYLGYTTPGTMTVSSGGEFDGALIWMGRNGGTGILNIGTGGTAGIMSNLYVDGGTLGTGTVNFNHTDPSYTFSPQLRATLTVNHIGTGTTTLSGANTFTGTTTLSAGTLVAGSTSAFGVSNLTAENGGTLNIGTTGVVLGVGIYTQNSGSTLALAVDNSSVYGSITSSSDAVVATNSIVNVTVNNSIEDNIALGIVDGAGGSNVSVPGTITDNDSDFSFNGSVNSGDLIITSAYPHITSGSRPRPKTVVSTPVSTPSAPIILEVATPTPTPSLSGEPVSCILIMTLRQGYRGTQVKCLQTKLNISADGIFGPMTKAAVMLFQKNHNLTQDGIVGPKTTGAIDEKK